MQLSKAHIQLLISTLLWGGSILFVKVSVQHGPPMHMAAIRFVMAAAILVPVILWTGWPRGLSRQDWRDIGLLGFLGIFLYNICFFYALYFTTAAEGALLMAASPVTHFILGALMERERLTALKAGGLVVSVVGIALVVLGGEQAQGNAPNRILGDVLMLVGMFFWALNSLLGKRMGRRLSPLVTTGLPVSVAALIYLTVTVPTGLLTTVAAMPWSGWAALGYLAIFSTIIGRQLWFAGLKGVDMTQAGVFFNVMPVWSLGLASLALGERPGWLQLVGGALVLVGVFLVTAKEPALENPSVRKLTS